MFVTTSTGFAIDRVTACHVVLAACFLNETILFALFASTDRVPAFWLRSLNQIIDRVVPFERFIIALASYTGFKFDSVIV